MSAPLLSTAVLQGLLACLHKHGLPAPELLAPSGHGVADLATPDAARSSAAFRALWHAALIRSGDPHLPFRIGQQMYVEQLGLLGAIVRNCATLADALVRLDKYSRLTNHLVDLQAHLRPPHLDIEFRFLPHARLDDFLVRVFTLFEFGYLSGGIGQLVQRTHIAAALHTHLPPADQAFLASELHCPVHAAAGNALQLDAALLAAPILLPDAALRRHLEQLADLELTQLLHAAAWAPRVRAILLQSWDGGRPSIDRVADALTVTVRALQRKLKAEGTSFQAEAERVRRELALRYLQQPFSVNEVAFFLGYEAPSAFTRAFKAWTGTTPQAYRQAKG